MKPLNFVDNISPKEHRSLRVWLYSSLLLISTVIITTTTLYIIQFKKVQTLRAEYATLETSAEQFKKLMEEKRELKEQEQLLKQQSAKITRIKERPKSPFCILELLITTIPKEISVYSLQLHKKQLQATLYGSHTQALLAYIKQL